MESRREQQGRVEGPLMNERIPHKTLQVISSDGKPMGVITRDEALIQARRENLDLVIISEREGEIPVAKILDYGKASYAKKKQQATAKKKQKVIQVKEVQVGPKISDHDLQTKMNNAVRFLEEGKHVKVVLTFRGRDSFSPSRDARGNELFERMDQVILQGPAGKHVQKEKDQRSHNDQKMVYTWSRVYSSK